MSLSSGAIAVRGIGSFATLCGVLLACSLSGCLTPASCHTSFGTHLYSSGRFPVHATGPGYIDGCHSAHDTHLLALSAGHGASYLRATVLPWRFCCGFQDFCVAMVGTAKGCVWTGATVVGDAGRTVANWRPADGAEVQDVPPPSDTNDGDPPTEPTPVSMR